MEFLTDIFPGKLLTQRKYFSLIITFTNLLQKQCLLIDENLGNAKSKKIKKSKKNQKNQEKQKKSNYPEITFVHI